MESSITSAFDC